MRRKFKNSNSKNLEGLAEKVDQLMHERQALIEIVMMLARTVQVDDVDAETGEVRRVSALDYFMERYGEI